MLARCLPALVLITPLVFGDVQFTSPGPGVSLTASGGTVKISAVWKDSGDDPPLDDLATFSIYLCAGGNTAGTYVCSSPFFTPQSENSTLNLRADLAPLLQGQVGDPLATGKRFSAGNTISATVPTTAGGSIDNA